MADRPEDDDRAAILKRRNRWIALALSGATAGSLATSCACLSPVERLDAATRDAGTDAGTDAGVPQPCLSRPAPDAGLDAEVPGDDAGGPAPDAAAPDASVDGGPTPCLAPIPDGGPDGGPDAGGRDAAPVPCLTPPAEEG